MSISWLLSLAILSAEPSGLRAKPPNASVSSESLRVTAKLVEIPASFPPDDLYDYAFVMKYEVRGGPMDKKSILVAHYKPRQKRAEIADAMRSHVSGTLKRFKVGDVHKLVLRADLETLWPGALVDEYFATDRTSVRYWCLQVDLE